MNICKDCYDEMRFGKIEGFFWSLFFFNKVPKKECDYCQIIKTKDRYKK